MEGVEWRREVWSGSLCNSGQNTRKDEERRNSVESGTVGTVGTVCRIYSVVRYVYVMRIIL